MTIGGAVSLVDLVIANPEVPISKLTTDVERLFSLKQVRPGWQFSKNSILFLRQLLMDLASLSVRLPWMMLWTFLGPK